MGQADTKLAFRKGVFRLFEEQIISPEDHAFWSQFWTLPESASDVFSLVGASEIRKIRNTAPQNLFILLDKLLATINAISRSPDFPSPADSTVKLLNCVRVLTRILPFIFESEDKSATWKDYFWESFTDNDKGKSADTENNENDDKSRTRNVAGTDAPKNRAEQIITTTVDLLFLVGLTLPKGVSSKPYLVWESGIGSTIEIFPTREMLSNRAEVLRLLLVLMSKTLYIPAPMTLSTANPWTEYLVSKMSKNVVLAVLCSLLNTTIKYNPSGWGLPYNHILIADHSESVVALSLQTLSALLDYQCGSRVTEEQRRTLDGANLSSSRSRTGSHNCLRSAFKETPTSSGSSSNANLQGAGNTSPPRSSETKQPSHDTVNLYRFYIGKIYKDRDIKFILNGVIRVLTNPMQASNTLLPGSTKRIKIHQETLMLLWRLIELNKKVATELLENDQEMDIMIILLYYQVENKDHAAHIGLVRMCAFILQSLSSDRAFALRLNRPFEMRANLPSSLKQSAFSGTYADFLIVTLHSLIYPIKSALAGLHPAYLLTLSNISPYLKGLSVKSSNKLVHLVSVFSNPGVLLAEEGNHLLLAYILQVLDYVIQYQFSDNPHLVYAIIRSHTKFEDLSSFTLEKGLEYINRRRDVTDASSETPSNPTACTKSHNTQMRREAITSVESSENSTGSPPEGTTNASETPTSRLVDPENRRDKTAPNYRGDNGDEGSLNPSDVVKDGTIDEENGRRIEAQKPAERVPAQIATLRRPSSASQHRVNAGFIPTEDWVSSWHSSLPLTSILTVTRALHPKMEDFCSKQSLNTQEEVVQFIKNESMVGLIPPPPPLSPKKFGWGDPVLFWFTSYLWGVIFVSNRTPLGIWNGTQMVLFTVLVQPAGGK